MAKVTPVQNATVVFYRDSELDNEATAPYYGWLYPKGASLRGQVPQMFETEESLCEAINEFKAQGISKLYFNSIPLQRAVRTF